MNEMETTLRFFRLLVAFYWPLLHHFFSFFWSLLPMKLEKLLNPDHNLIVCQYFGQILVLNAK